MRIGRWAGAQPLAQLRPNAAGPTRYARDGDGLLLPDQYDQPTVAPSPMGLVNFKMPSEIMNHFGRKGGPQGIEHGQNVNDLLGDGAIHRT